MDFPFCFLTQTSNNDFWTMVTAIVAGIGLYFAWKQLKEIAKTNRADFLFRFTRDFFYENKETRKIIIAIEDKKPLLIIHKGKFDEYDVDDYIGYFDLMKGYLDKDLMTFEDIDDSFGHYISLAWKNEEIKKYIMKLRKKYNDHRYYEPFEKLAEMVIGKENEVRTKISPKEK